MNQAHPLLRDRRFRRCAFATLLLLATGATRAFDVTITSGASGNGSWSGNTWTPTAAGSTVAASEIQTRLASGNVTVAATGTDKLTVNAAIAWSANTLTLKAGGDILIKTPLNGSATAGLAFEYGQSGVASGNGAVYTINARVNLPASVDGGSFSTRQGSDGTPVAYTIITRLGAAGSTTGTDLQGMNGNLAGKYVLGADIDAAATATWNPDGSGGYYGFAPIGMPFTGSFNGLGHVIDALTVKNRSRAGLFSVTSGVVTNIGLTNVDIAAGSAGALAGGALAAVNQGAISNAWVEGGRVVTTNSTRAVALGGLVGANGQGSLIDVHAAVEVTNNNVAGLSNIGTGGLVGYSTGSFPPLGEITRAYSTGRVSGGENVGGLVGDLKGGRISDAYATGDVVGDTSGTSIIGVPGSSVGGLVGLYDPDTDAGTGIDRAYAAGRVSGSENIGGLVGYKSGGVSPEMHWINSAYATGAVTGNDYVGGLIGKVGPYQGVYVARGMYLEESYATGAVTATVGPHVGGLVGGDVASLTDPYYLVWDTESTGQASSGLPTDYTIAGRCRGVTSAQMKQLATYDFTFLGQYYGFRISTQGGDNNIWRLYEGQAAPLLRSFLTPLTVTANDATKAYDGNPYSGGNGVTYSETPNANLLGTLSYGGSSQGAVNNGNYVITPGGLYSNQLGYDIQFVAGALVVGPSYTVMVHAGTGGTASCTPTISIPGGAITCTATPNAGYSFAGWSGGCSGSFAIAGNMNCTASFSLNSYTIAASASPPAGGTASCAPNPASHGGTVLCSATPNAGYSFAGWNGGCATSFTASGNLNCTASFSLNSYTVTASASPLAGGTASCTPSPASHGSTVNCSATPNAGYLFTGWSGGCAASFAITGDMACTASFLPGVSRPLPGGGTGTTTVAGGGGSCVFVSAQFVAVSSIATPPPTQLRFPLDLFDFQLDGCAEGSTVEVTITYPSVLPAGARYWKYGPTAANPEPHWYVFNNAVINGDTVTLTITDGGLGDDDLLADGAIADAGGPAMAGAVAIPTLSEWGLILLSALLLLAGARRRSVGVPE